MMDLRWLAALVGVLVGVAIGFGLATVLDDDGEDDATGGALVCSEFDAAALGSLVIVGSPAAGERVAGELTVSGCAATFEQNVRYRVTDRMGEVLAEGFTTATAPDIGMTGPFSVTVDIGAPEPGLLSLEVLEEDVSDGEGFPPPRHVVPLVAG
jgi:hypothetical protein